MVLREATVFPEGSRLYNGKMEQSQEALDIISYILHLMLFCFTKPTFIKTFLHI